MNLKDYISDLGDEKFAKKHQVTPRCARSWRTGHRQPRPAKGLEIAKKSGGKLTFSDVYAP